MSIFENLSRRISQKSVGDSGQKNPSTKEMLSSLELKYVEAYQNEMGCTAWRSMSPPLRRTSTPLSFSEIHCIAQKQVEDVLRVGHISRQGMTKAVNIVKQDAVKQQDAVDGLLLLMPNVQNM